MNPKGKEGCSMDEDNRDPQAAGRGIVYGILLGAAFWLLLLAGVWKWFR